MFYTYFTGKNILFIQFFTIFLWFLTQIYRILLLYHKSNVSRETLLLFYLFIIVSRETINSPIYNRKRFNTPNKPTLV